LDFFFLRQCPICKRDISTPTETTRLLSRPNHSSRSGGSYRRVPSSVNPSSTAATTPSSLRHPTRSVSGCGSGSRAGSGAGSGTGSARAGSGSSNSAGSSSGTRSGSSHIPTPESVLTPSSSSKPEAATVTLPSLVAPSEPALDHLHRPPAGTSSTSARKRGTVGTGVESRDGADVVIPMADEEAFPSWPTSKQPKEGDPMDQV